MFAASPFNGVSVYVRQSPATEVEDCLDPATAGCQVSRQSFQTIFMDFSANQQEEVPQTSNVQKQLKYCSYSSCALFTTGCLNSYTSGKVSVQQTSASTWTLQNEDANSDSQWTETICLKCTHATSGVEVTVDSIKIIKLAKLGGQCGWRLVRFWPGGSTSWFQSTDQLAGTDVFGDNTDNSAAWSIPFSQLTFDQFLFTTNNHQHFVILSKSTFTPGVWIPGLMTTNIRSSVTPNSPGTS